MMLTLVAEQGCLDTPRSRHILMGDATSPLGNLCLPEALDTVSGDAL